MNELMIHSLFVTVVEQLRVCPLAVEGVMLEQKVILLCNILCIPVFQQSLKNFVQDMQYSNLELSAFRLWHRYFDWNNRFRKIFRSFNLIVPIQ